MGLTGDLTPEQVAIVAAAGGAVVAYAEWSGKTFLGENIR